MDVGTTGWKGAICAAATVVFVERSEFVAVVSVCVLSTVFVFVEESVFVGVFVFSALEVESSTNSVVGGLK